MISGPRIEGGDAAAFEVAGVAGDDGEVVNERGGGDEGISCLRSVPCSIERADKQSPSFCNFDRDRENGKCVVSARNAPKPCFEPPAPFAFGETNESAKQLADADGAREGFRFAWRPDPFNDAPVRTPIERVR